MKHKILLVDDELLLLDSLRRELGFKYDIDTAESGAEGLEKLARLGPYAVVISDFRMPKMDGVKFLMRVTEIAPDTVRMMLTGNADLPTAIEAINKGKIFRFLSKPCSGELLNQAIDAGLRQYQLVIAEKELLENTLKETISMLSEVLAIVNPRAYGRSLRMQQLVAHIVKYLRLENGWQYETAAALSQLGWIIFSADMLEKLERGQSFSASEAMTFSKHPFVASKLLNKIPRLEQIAQMIVGQDRSIDDLCLDSDFKEAYAIDLGSHILKVCVDYDELLLQGLLHHQVLEKLQSRRNAYLPKVLNALSNLHSFHPETSDTLVDVILIRDLEDGMILLEPIRNTNGDILVKERTFITRSILVAIFGMSSHSNVLVEPIKVERLRLPGKPIG